MWFTYFLCDISTTIRFLDIHSGTHIHVALRMSLKSFERLKVIEMVFWFLRSRSTQVLTSLCYWSGSILKGLKISKHRDWKRLRTWTILDSSCSTDACSLGWTVALIICRFITPYLCRALWCSCSTPFSWRSQRSYRKKKYRVTLQHFFVQIMKLPYIL